jgi:2-methylisocitrate lyase-like PEP mutase family enzyme
LAIGLGSSHHGGNDMTTRDKNQLLRNLINAPEILVLPGVYDGYSARLV